MADQQIFMGDSGAAPLVYPVPPAVEFRLKAVNADFDGSAASGEWLPAVVISSDSGHVIARAVDPGAPVAAGGSAEASFFPGVKRTSAGSTPSALNIPWAFIASTGGEAVPHASGITLAMAGANFATNDPGVFTIRAGSPPAQGIAIHALGVYHVTYWVEALTNGTASPAPSATMLWLNPGVSFSDTYPNEVDLTGDQAYGAIVQGTSPNLNMWETRAVYLVGIASLGSERFVTVGVTNRSPTYDIPATGGQGAFGRITVMRLSDGIADYGPFN